MQIYIQEMNRDTCEANITCPCALLDWSLLNSDYSVTHSHTQSFLLAYAKMANMKDVSSQLIQYHLLPFITIQSAVQFYKSITLTLSRTQTQDYTPRSCVKVIASSNRVTSSQNKLQYAQYAQQWTLEHKLNSRDWLNTWKMMQSASRIHYCIYISIMLSICH